MGTSNFFNLNAPCVYVVNPDSTEVDEEGKEIDIDIDWEFEIEYLRESIIDLLTEKTRDNGLYSVFPSSGWQGKSRNYDGREIASLDLCAPLFCGVDISFSMVILLRFGYYQAANLDYDYIWEIDGDEVESPGHALDQWLWNMERYGKHGLAEIHSNSAKKLINKLKSDCELVVNEVLKQVSTPYGVTARFSNGETIYHKIDK